MGPPAPKGRGEKVKRGVIDRNKRKEETRFHKVLNACRTGERSEQTVKKEHSWPLHRAKSPFEGRKAWRYRLRWLARRRGVYQTPRLRSPCVGSLVRMGARDFLFWREIRTNRIMERLMEKKTGGGLRPLHHAPYSVHLNGQVRRGLTAPSPYWCSGCKIAEG